MTKVQKRTVTVITITIFIVIFAVIYFGYSRKPKTVMLRAEQKMELADRNYAFTFYSDSTYTIIESNFDNNKAYSHNYDGRYYLISDSIYFKDIINLKFPVNALQSKKAVIKNNIIEFITTRYYQRMIITKRALNLKSNIDTDKHPDFAVFTYNPKIYDYFPKGYQPYDLNEIDIIRIIEIFDRCVPSRGGKKSKDYWKQCTTVINSKGEKEVYIDCSCERSDRFQYGFRHVSDGGPCFMSMKINLTTGQCYDMYFNGVA